MRKSLYLANRTNLLLTRPARKICSGTIFLPCQQNLSSTSSANAKDMLCRNRSYLLYQRERYALGQSFYPANRTYLLLARPTRKICSAAIVLPCQQNQFCTCSTDVLFVLFSLYQESRKKRSFQTVCLMR